MNRSDDCPYLELPASNGETIKVLRTPHPRARRLRLTVTSHGARLTYPAGTHSSQVFAFLRKNAEWLEQKLDQLHIDPLGNVPLAIGVPTLLPLRGEITQLVWQQGLFPHIEHRVTNAENLSKNHRERESVEGGRSTGTGACNEVCEDSEHRPTSNHTRAAGFWTGSQLIITLPTLQESRMAVASRALLQSFLQAQIHRDTSRWLAQYVTELERAPTGIRIKPLKSLWGSLDTRNRVTLDLSLALAPTEALKYVLIHELCHLRVRNHSPRFWALVASLYPTWQDQRQWLRVHGHALKAELARLTESQ